jgi:hypothetical protein
LSLVFIEGLVPELLKTIDFILSYRYIFLIFEKIIKLLKLKTPHELGTTSIIKRQGDTSKRLRIEQDELVWF